MSNLKELDGTLQYQAVVIFVNVDLSTTFHAQLLRKCIVSLNRNIPFS